MNRSVTTTINVATEKDISVPLWLRPLTNKLIKGKVSAIIIMLPSGTSFRIGETAPEIFEPCICINNIGAVLKGLSGGTTGWAEGYMDGNWDTPDLNKLTDWALFNEAKLKAIMEQGFLRKWLDRIQHLRNNNSLRGSRRNIAYHYDLGNDFYRLWLDETMSYSSALFTEPRQSIEEAQVNKYETIFEMTEAKDNASFLEIGCGWGGFAETIAKRPSMTLHGVTLSQEQLGWAQRRMTDMNAADRVQLEYKDYRHLDKEYDNIVSIEMFEAVGEENWPTYFKTLFDRLKPGGTAVLQIICIDKDRFETYRNQADFIQKYIFPGGMLPTVDAIKELSEQQDMVLESTLSFGQDYAHTLRYWSDQFERHWGEIQPQGFDDRFKRMWQFYLAYCESGFRFDALDVRLFKIRKPA